jgi:NitT/TauT family transport system substrate-binding protein
MRGHLRAIAVLAITAALGLPALPAAHAAPAGTGQPIYPAPGPKRKLVLGMPVAPPNVVHTPMALAKEFGFTDRFNIDLEIKNFEGSTRALTAAIAGDVHVGTLDCVNAFGNGVPLVGVYGGAPKLPVVMVARDPIRDIKDLRGKKIGMSSAPGGFIDRMNRAVLAAANIRPEEVTIVQTTTAGRVPSLISGQTDTAIFHYEQASRLLRQVPGTRVIFDLQQALPNYQYHVYCAMRSVVERNREAIIDLVAATILAVRHAVNNRAEAVRALVKLTGAEELDAGYAYAQMIARCVWARNLGLDVRRIQWTVDYAYEGGEMKQRYQAAQLLDMSIANEALRRAGGPVPVPQGCQ